METKIIGCNNRKILVFLGVFGVVFFFTSIVFACFIEFEPANIRANSDGRASFDAIIRWEHRRCVLDDNDVNVDTKSVKILSQTGWKQFKRAHFKNHFDVQLTAKEGSLRIWRECSKKGISEHTIRIKR